MNCNVVRDLLPVYFDGLCSEETVAQMEEHMEQCEECKKVRQSLGAEEMLPAETEQWDRAIAPLKKVKKTIRKKNGWLVACVCVLLLILGMTSVLTYGQITKKGISFELLYDAMRLRSIGKQFAQGNVEPLYEILYNGYVLRDEESEVLRLVYNDSEAYDADMKATISEKYHQLFDGRQLTFRGIDEIRYEVFPRIGENPVIYAALKFEGEEGLLYYIGLYKTEEGSFLVSDYFGNPYLFFTEEANSEEKTTDTTENYHTNDTLFSCMPNALYEFDFSMTRYMVAVKGKRALQGDMTLIENGQMPHVIFSAEDIKNGTDTLRLELEEELAMFAEEGYYLSDLTWNVKEYDKECHLYRGELELELTKAEGEKQKGIRMNCYRVADYFVGTSEPRTIYEK